MLSQQAQVPEKESRFLLNGALRAEKRAFWKEVIGSWEGSRETAAGFSRDREIPIAQFNYWKKRFASFTSTDDSEDVRFVQFPGPSADTATCIQLEWRDFTITVNDGADERTLTMVLRAMGALR